MSRHLLALALAAAVGASPLVMDLCAESCEAMHIAVDPVAAPACHHVTSPTSRVETVPAGCGHDHNGVTMTAEQGKSVSPRTVFVAVHQAASPARVPSATRPSWVRLASSPPPDRLAQGLTSLLRI